jgi:hemerythrin-like domain-containing protein
MEMETITVGQGGKSMFAGVFTSRRRFLRLTGSLAAGLALPAIPNATLAAEKKDGKEKGPEVNPVEDLMREHGVLRRVLLIYEESIKRINGAGQLPPGVVADTAGIVRRFVEDYHEKLEEDEIFPRLEKAGKLSDLVQVLFTQHQAGRRLTDSILKLSEPEVLKTAKVGQEDSATMQQIYGGTPLFHFKKDTRHGLASAMQEFTRMYRPHADREDTVLFPAFRSIVSPKEFDELGEKFEDREDALFGNGAVCGGD